MISSRFQAVAVRRLRTQFSSTDSGPAGPANTALPVGITTLTSGSPFGSNATRNRPGTAPRSTVLSAPRASVCAFKARCIPLLRLSLACTACGPCTPSR